MFNHSMSAKMSSTSSLLKSTKTSVQANSSTSNEKQIMDLIEDISDNISQLTVSGNISQILSQFECCVCLEYINPPILQCRNSHLFCRTCRQKFKSPFKCPTCRAELIQDIRNHSLEQIAENLYLPFPCKYKTNGCVVTSRLTEKAKHENLCEYKPFKCPDMSKECDWSGSGDQLVQHLIDEHYYLEDIHLSIQTIDLINLHYLKFCNTFWSSLLNTKNQNFVIIHKYQTISDKQYQIEIFVLFIGEQRIADKYKYKIQIINKSNCKELQWIDKPISIRKNIKWLLSFSNTEGFRLDQIMFNKLSLDNYLEVKITIES